MKNQTPQSKRRPKPRDIERGSYTTRVMERVQRRARQGESEDEAK